MYPNLKKSAFIKMKPEKTFITTFIKCKRYDFELNNSATEILSYCNGYNSMEDIIDILALKYNEDYETVKSNVEYIINPFIKVGIINDKYSKNNHKITRGNKEINLPDTVIWEITEKCPLKCKHCYLGEKNQETVSKDDIDRIIDEEIIKNGITTVQLTGGEPLTHPQIGYIISKLADENITVYITTSGTVYNDDIINIISKIKLAGGGVQVSIDGLEQYHNNIRGNNNAYSKSIEFLKKLVCNDIICSVATCLINQSKADIISLSENLKNIGVNEHILSVLIDKGDAENNGLDSYYNHTKTKMLISELNSSLKTEKFRIREYTKSNEKNCGAGYNLLMIKANLDIIPCPMMNIKLGNLKFNSLTNICRNTTKHFKTMSSPNKDICLECEDVEKCGRCMSRALDKKMKCNWYYSQQSYISNIYENIKLY